MAKLTCPACGWRDAQPVRLSGANYGCPVCETNIFAYGGQRVYLHGGVRGLDVGMRLLPREQTGATGTLRETAFNLGLVREGEARADRVYMTTRYETAALYAAAHPSLGRVYLVEPLGAVEVDPASTERGLSFQAEEALILRVSDVSKEELVRILRKLKSYEVARAQTKKVEDKANERKENDDRAERQTEAKASSEDTGQRQSYPSSLWTGHSP